MKTRVLRAFLIQGERQEPGKQLDLAEGLAIELLQMGKVERVVEAPPAPSVMTVTPVEPVSNDTTIHAPRRGRTPHAG